MILLPRSRAYVSVGVASIACRGTIPLILEERDGKPAHGGEIGLVLGLKLPWNIHGNEKSLGMSGRPLRHEGRILEAPVVLGRETWAGGGAEPLTAALDDATRGALADAWLSDARAEHASIAAFARLALDLMAVGAPADLIEQAHRAALDEVEHARLCFGFASAYAGATLSAGPLPLGDGRAAFSAGSGGAKGEGERDRSLAAELGRLAAESWLDGCVGEGAAAACIRAALRRASDPAVRAALRTIAPDEARHAALAWSVVRFCLTEGGCVAAEALEYAMDAAVPRESVPPEASPSPSAAACVEAQSPLRALLDAHGRLDEAIMAERLESVRAAAIKRARGLIDEGRRRAARVRTNPIVPHPSCGS